MECFGDFGGNSKASASDCGCSEIYEPSLASGRTLAISDAASVSGYAIDSDRLLQLSKPRQHNEGVSPNHTGQQIWETSNNVVKFC